MVARLHAFNEGIPFVVFLVDRPDGFFDPTQEVFRIVQCDTFVSQKTFRQMAGYYTAYELCNALKVFGHQYMAAAGFDRWIYLDSDIQICGSFEKIFAALDEASLLITPHILLPAPFSSTEQLELSFLNMGVYNGGMLGLRNCQSSRIFLEWWKERLLFYCLHMERGLEVDQSWLNFAPLLFDGVCVWRSAATNVAYWNIHERILALQGNGTFTVDGERVPFIHLSGWDWRTPSIPTKHGSCSLGLSAEAWNALAMSFAGDLLHCGVEATSQWPYSFAEGKTGVLLTPKMRRRYWQAVRTGDPVDSVVSIFDEPDAYQEPAPKTMSVKKAFVTLVMAVRHKISKVLSGSDVQHQRA